MSESAATRLGRFSPLDQIRYAREILNMEARAIDQVATRLDSDFHRACEYLEHCLGSVVVTGMGKAGLIGQKISATLASTGTRSIFLHPAEAVHGDLGRVRGDDVVLALSHSGETEELLRLLPTLEELSVPVVAVTTSSSSRLGRAARVVLEMGPLREACSLGLAPSTSTTAMLALGDALALVTSRLRAFGRRDFARLHPAGNLGRQLSRVEAWMRPLQECRVAVETETVREVFSSSRRPGRRSGAVLLVDESERLSGIFTDSDLARLFESRRDASLDGPIREVMTAPPCSVSAGAMLADALAILAERKISELPVVTASMQPMGMIDVTDVVGMIPEVRAA